MEEVVSHIMMHEKIDIAIDIQGYSNNSTLVFKYLKNCFCKRKSFAD